MIHDATWYEKNFEVISKFTKDSGEIRADCKTGSLYEAGGLGQSLFHKINYINPGTELDGTVPYIQKTADHYLAQFDKAFAEYNEGRNILPTDMIRKLLLLSKGIKTITSVYQATYSTTPEQPGLQELIALNQRYQIGLDERTRKCQEAVRPKPVLCPEKRAVVDCLRALDVIKVPKYVELARLIVDSIDEEVSKDLDAPSQAELDALAKCLQDL